jgi:hypothetical protein
VQLQLRLRVPTTVERSHFATLFFGVSTGQARLVYPRDRLRLRSAIRIEWLQIIVVDAAHEAGLRRHGLARSFWEFKRQSACITDVRALPKVADVSGRGAIAVSTRLMHARSSDQPHAAAGSSAVDGEYDGHPNEKHVDGSEQDVGHKEVVHDSLTQTSAVTPDYRCKSQMNR